MQKRILLWLGAIVILSATLLGQGAGAWYSVNWNRLQAYWYNDDEMYSFLIWCSPVPGYFLEVGDNPRIFRSLDPVEWVYNAPYTDGSIIVYSQIRGLTREDTTIYGGFMLHMSGLAYVGTYARIIGIINQEEAGPFVGTAFGFTDRIDIDTFSLGVYNIGNQMTAGNWIGPGAIKTNPGYNPSFWMSEAKVLLADIGESTFYRDHAYIYDALSRGKIVILPSAAFRIIAAESGKSVQSLGYADLTFQYIQYGSGGIINASTDDSNIWSCDWVFQAGEWYYPQRYVPSWIYLTLAKGYNRACMALGNQPPYASCRNIILPANGNGQANITAADIDAGSYDPNDDSFSLSIDNIGPFSLGDHFVELTVTDEHGASSSCQAKVTVVDVTPPTIELSVTPNVLWPPNHKMIQVFPTITATDNCDPNPIVKLKSITMNEGDETNTYDPAFDPTTGDGNTIGDMQVNTNGAVFLRAERKGNGSGRIYTITYMVTDAAGNTATASVTVAVPHNQ